MACIPGDQKCIGDDLYKCRQYYDTYYHEYRTEWYLFDRNSPQCVEEPETSHLSVYVPPWAAGGYVEPGSGDYRTYSTVKLTAHPLSGYEFVSWGGDASGTNPTYNLYMDSDKNVEAYFMKVPVEVFAGTIITKELEYDETRGNIPVY